jgi:hypothetical protein
MYIGDGDGSMKIAVKQKLPSKNGRMKIAVKQKLLSKMGPFNVYIYHRPHGKDTALPNNINYNGFPAYTTYGIKENIENDFRQGVVGPKTSSTLVFLELETKVKKNKDMDAFALLHHSYECGPEISNFYINDKYPQIKLSEEERKNKSYEDQVEILKTKYEDNYLKCTFLNFIKKLCNNEFCNEFCKEESDQKCIISINEEERQKDPFFWKIMGLKYPDKKLCFPYISLDTI